MITDFILILTFMLVICTVLWEIVDKTMEKKEPQLTEYQLEYLKYLIEKDKQEMYGDKKASVQSPPFEHPVTIKRV